jgi:ParB-like chromosome segregation protein Spo0J
MRREAAHIREVAVSIGRLGFSVPVLVGSDNIILIGTISVEVARQLDLSKVPCIRIHHLSPTGQRLLPMAVVQTPEISARGCSGT